MEDYSIRRNRPSILLIYIASLNKLGIITRKPWLIDAF